METTGVLDIFRCQLWRHLLQSGWSVFVSSKRLVAGDAFIFLRCANHLYMFHIPRTSFKRI
ncbi:hypothetical protein ACSBR1_041487 [Camellia fascicularis]